MRVLHRKASHRPLERHEAFVDGVFLACTELWIAGSHQLWKRRLSQIRAIASKDLWEIDLCDWPTAPTIPLSAWVIFLSRFDETANC